jgi:hypothetical protein
MCAVISGCKLEGTVDENSNSWANFELHYKEGKFPILVELNRTDEAEDIGILSLLINLFLTTARLNPATIWVFGLRARYLILY